MPILDLAAERRHRGWILGIAIAAIFFVIAGRLFALQIVRGKRYEDQAQRNLIRPDPIPALRGCIYDRAGRLLAGNEISLDLALEVGHPAYRRRDDVRAAVEEVAAALELDPAPLVERALHDRRLFAPLILAENLTPEQIATLFERIDPIPGLRVERTPRRSYPYGCVGAHLLGYVGEVSERELAADADSGYCLESFVGRAGIERQYEQLLRGVPGSTYVTVDAMGRKTDLFPEIAPRAAHPGNDLMLAVDLRLQALADSMLAGIRPEHGGEAFGATVIALEPWTGDVLACASYPNYDPNRFAEGMKSGEWAALQDDTYPLLNRSVQALYPPGSLFKVVTTLAGLEEGAAGLGTRMPAGCGGSYRFGSRTFRCWQSRGHGSVDLRGAFAQSCDVYYYQLGKRLGLARLTNFAHDLGVDAPTEIDLPEEKCGLVPTPDWYRRKLGEAPPEGNVLNLAIGQGELLVTPLGMAVLVSAIVTDGWVRQPRVALRAAAPDGTVVWDAGAPVRLRKLPVSDRDREIVRDLLEEVVAHGTGGRAKIENIRVGGKTGTAQNPHGEDHGLFLAVAPIEAPRIVVVVVVERAGHGGVVAAPVAQRLMERLLVPPKPKEPADTAAVVDSLQITQAQADSIARVDSLRLARMEVEWWGNEWHGPDASAPDSAQAQADSAAAAVGAGVQAGGEAGVEAGVDASVEAHGDAPVDAGAAGRDGGFPVDAPALPKADSLARERSR